MDNNKYSNPPPMLRYETSISICSLNDEDESSSGTSSSLDTPSSSSSSTRSIYDDERSISLIAAEYSVNTLLDCLSKYGVQHDTIQTAALDNDLDYLHILTMSHNHVNNIMKSKDISVSIKTILLDSLMTAWKDLNNFLAIQHQISFKAYHKVRRELEVDYKILPNDHFVHPNVYAKIKEVQQQKVYKALCFMNEVSELYCSSLKGLALTQNLMTKYHYLS